MGLRGVGPGSLLLILLIIVFLFGTKRIKSVGADLAEAIKNFRKGMTEEERKD